MNHDKTTVVVVPLPAELVQPIIDLQGRSHEGRATDTGGSASWSERFGQSADPPR
jgi:hypothetical protein